ncbi:MAG: hypothetical protein FADNKDHG_01360 [Holosporales bacterium]
MIYGYVRVSQKDQNVESQKNLISRYGVEHKMMVDEWIEVEMSSRKSTKDRRTDELLQKINTGDTISLSRTNMGQNIF